MPMSRCLVHRLSPVRDESAGRKSPANGDLCRQAAPGVRVETLECVVGVVLRG